MKKILIVIGLMAIIIFIFFRYYGCSTETKEFTLPNNNHIKFVAKIQNCGATTSFLYKLYMISKDDKVGFFDNSIFESNDIAPSIYWIDSYHLKIESNSTRIYKFTNFKYINNEEYLIQLVSP